MGIWIVHCLSDNAADRVGHIWSVMMRVNYGDTTGCLIPFVVIMAIPTAFYFLSYWI